MTRWYFWRDACPWFLTGRAGRRFDLVAGVSVRPYCGDVLGRRRGARQEWDPTAHARRSSTVPAARSLRSESARRGPRPSSPGMPLTVDSRDHPACSRRECSPCARPAGTASRNYRRLLSMVDWYSDAGDLVSLHSDHSVSTRTTPIDTRRSFFWRRPRRHAIPWS